MKFKEDITIKIGNDFGENANQALQILNTAIKKTIYLKTDRVIRCIIYLSKGNINDLNKYIELATYDTRDLMFGAEYENLNGEPKRYRDFNNTFEDCVKNVNE